jgi:uncharacterized protein
MQYRTFGQMDWKVSALGFGAMRLPTVSEGGKEVVDEAETIKMIRTAIDQGVNYVDTAYPYHDGQSEVVVGKALQDGYRDKVKVATKLPCWLVEKPEDFDTLLNEELRRLQTEHVEFYLLHALWKDRWAKMRDMHVFEWAERAIADGRIGHLGFSFHDQLSLFKEIVDAYDWSLCQIQYNFMNETVQAGTEGLRYAADKGLAVVVMEPLLGGTLAKAPPSVQAIILDEAGKEPVDLALQWLWNQPEVGTVLSGMSTLKQVEHNVACAARSGVNSLTSDDLAVIARVQAQYQEAQAIPCTKCGYCLPCPQGVDIPRNFELYNEGMIYDEWNLCKNLYNGHFRESERASACIACKECEEKCPQQILISEWMPKVHAALVRP